MLKKRYPEYCLTALLSTLILSIIILSWVPPVSRDALTHHLAVPKLYIQHGGIYEIPSMKFSYYPMNIELIYMIPIYFGNDIIPKLIHFAFALGTAWIIFVYLKCRINIFYGLFGSLLFLSTPIIVKLSTTAYVDLGLVFFSTLSLIILLKWADENYQLKYLVYSAVCCGLALGTKYNGLVVLFLLTLFVPIIYLRRFCDDHKTHPDHLSKKVLTQLKAMGNSVLFIMIALIIFSPWMIRNFHWKGNPIYPLYHDIIKSKVKISPEKPQRRNIIADLKYRLPQKQKARWNHFSIRRLIYKESWSQILLIPIRIFFQGEDGNPKYFDGKLNPLLLILPLFAFIFRRREIFIIKRNLLILISISVSFILFAFFTHDMRIRYITPILPLLVILAVFGYKMILEVISEKCLCHYRKFWTYLFSVCVAIFIMMNLWYLVGQFKYVRPFDYISGKLNREEYITTFRPEYPVIKYANEHLNDESNILGVFMGNRRYYSDIDMVFNEKLMLKSIQKNMPAIDVLRKLQKASITHTIIWETYFIQWVNNNLNNEQITILKTFFKRYARSLFSSNGYTLLLLIDPENIQPINDK